MPTGVTECKVEGLSGKKIKVLISNLLKIMNHNDKEFEMLEIQVESLLNLAIRIILNPNDETKDPS